MVGASHARLSRLAQVVESGISGEFQLNKHSQVSDIKEGRCEISSWHLNFCGRDLRRGSCLSEIPDATKIFMKVG